MKRLIPLAFLVLATPAFAQSAPEPRGAGRPQRAYANPSALIAADIGFSRLAREKGQWTAFRETADDSAEMFEGGRKQAKALLKDRRDPPAPVQWAPHLAWISCDGTAGLTYGAWQGPTGENGEYVTVWQRQFKGKVDWKWVLDDGQDLASPLREVDWAEGKVAECPARQRAAGDPPPQPGSKRERKERSKLPPLRPLAGAIPAPQGGESKDGQSRDGSLAWRSTVMADGSRRFTAWIWKDGAMTEVIARSFKPQGA
ncbi:MAG: hypothetical protein VW935_04990 [Novosphingobium sp.]|jgi:hypothetical protein